MPTTVKKRNGYNKAGPVSQKQKDFARNLCLSEEEIDRLETSQAASAAITVRINKQDEFLRKHGERWATWRQRLMLVQLQSKGMPYEDADNTTITEATARMTQWLLQNPAADQAITATQKAYWLELDSDADIPPDCTSTQALIAINDLAGQPKAPTQAQLDQLEKFGLLAPGDDTQGLTRKEASNLISDAIEQQKQQRQLKQSQ